MIEIELWIRIAYPDQVWLSSVPSSSLRSRSLVCSFRSTFSAQIEFSSPLYFAFLVAFVPFCPFLHALCHLPFAICHFAICIWLGKAIRKMQFPLHTHRRRDTHVTKRKVEAGKVGGLSCLALAEQKKKKRRRSRQIQLTLTKSNQRRINANCHYISVISACKFKRNI